MHFSKIKKCLKFFIGIFFLLLDILESEKLGVIMPMKKERVFEILNGSQIQDVFYQDKPVWIQDIQGDQAIVGFMNASDPRKIAISELYEK